ncbi:MAG: Crp/Fnr family transcriptional regulator [Clostridia bacterium]|nr:Crp/Fnr family transcriptional regulator [Clostridia bacterium]
MRRYLSILCQCSLFERIDEEGLMKTLTCLNAQVISCEKGKVIFAQGDKPRCFGVVIHGGVHMITSDTLGNHSVIWSIGQGEPFGETYASAGVEAYPSSFVAAQDSLVLILDCARVLKGCVNNGCLAHSYMVTNLVRSVSRKNLLLTRKLEMVTQRSTRGKLLAYLRIQSKEAKSSRFTIPYDRQTLADYLCVERSAMSAELSRMKKDGLIDYQRNEFILFDSQNEA